MLTSTIETTSKVRKWLIWKNKSPLNSKMSEVWTPTKGNTSTTFSVTLLLFCFSFGFKYLIKLSPAWKNKNKKKNNENTEPSSQTIWKQGKNATEWVFWCYCVSAAIAKILFIVENLHTNREFWYMKMLKYSIKFIR